MTSASHPTDRMKTDSLHTHWQDHAIAAAVIIAAAVMHSLHPGDARWIHDETALIGLAEEYNAEGRMAPYGLEGTRGARYGPLPLWIYQACLAAGLDDLPTLVAVRAVAMTVTTGGALLVIGRAAGIMAWPLMLAVVSPWFWIYSRTLWDNTLLIPLAGWAVAGYSMCLGGCAWGVVVAAACSGAMILTHLMCLPLVAALILHAAIARPRELLTVSWPLAGVVGAIAVTGLSYWPVLAADLSARESRPMVLGEALWFLLNAGDWFHGPAFGSVVGADWLREFSVVGRVLLNAMGIASACAVASLVYAVAVVWHASRTGGPWSIRHHLCGFALGTLALALPFHAVLGAVKVVHYYNSLWIVYAMAIGLGADALLKFRGLWPVLALVLLTAAASTLTIALRIHATGGTRTLAYGPTLANQQAVARSIAGLPAGSSVETDIPNIAGTAVRMMVLVRRQRTVVTPQPGPAVKGLISYATDQPCDGRIRLECESDKKQADRHDTRRFPALGEAL